MKPYYEADGITIYHGDCRDVLPELIPSSYAAVIMDPPYGIGHASNRAGAPRRGCAIEGDDSAEVRNTVLAMIGDIPCLVFGTCRVPAPAKIRAVLVWDKGGHVGMGDLSLPWKQNWEHIYVIGDGFAGRRGTGVLHFNALAPWAGVISHPHEKPVDLLQELLSKCPAGTILDPFMGSGTALVAAKNLGRRAIGIEIEERYCEIAARRLAQGVLDLAPA